MFKWFAALGMDSPVEVSENLAGIILPHLHRELTVGDGGMGFAPVLINK